MVEISNKSRLWFWAKRTCLRQGGFHEKHIIRGENLRMFADDIDRVIHIESANGRCAVRILCFDDNLCSICG